MISAVRREGPHTEQGEVRVEGAGLTLTLKSEKTSEHTYLSRGMKKVRLLHCLIPYEHTGCFGLVLVLSCLQAGSGCVAPGSVELPI